MSKYEDNTISKICNPINCYYANELAISAGYSAKIEAKNECKLCSYNFFSLSKTREMILNELKK